MTKIKSLSKKLYLNVEIKISLKKILKICCFLEYLMSKKFKTNFSYSIVLNYFKNTDFLKELIVSITIQLFKQKY